MAYASCLIKCSFSDAFYTDKLLLWISVDILPQVYLYNGNKREYILIWTIKKKKPVPVLVPLLVGTIIAGSTAKGTSGLNMGGENLSREIDEHTHILKCPFLI